AAHGEERPLGVGVLLRPGRSAVGGPEDAPELARHPALLIGGEARGEEILPDAPDVDRLGTGDRRAGQKERGDDGLHADPPPRFMPSPCRPEDCTARSASAYPCPGRSVNGVVRHAAPWSA